MHCSPAGQVCPLCGGEGVPVGQKDGVTLRECRCVGRTLLAWAWRSEQEYESLYTTPRLYHEEEQEREGQAPSVQRDMAHMVASARRLQFLSALLLHSQGPLLDVGCGTGAFVALAEAQGWNARGCDPSLELVQFGNALGRSLWHGTWRDVADRFGYTVITLHDVLEHLTRPLDALLHLKDCLRPGGLLCVEIPEWGCPQSVAEGLDWRHVRPRQHLFLPDDDAARALFRLAGFGVELSYRPLRGQCGKIAYFLSPEDD